MQKVASVKGRRKTERKGATNKIENGSWQKKTTTTTTTTKLAYAHARN